ncbi:hypothetical protein A2V68_02795 [candidate division Kazan bacterium RBG_13_50_9]|uniref:Major facilitator superfamily (MFS) profile domain-containing protein n=1 Tax=candidate division Kazan bacterium RBG_13_50_9 TaxID=1798535 RepID=A0A1F4NSP2_UNCK3|nr:MAG: hypothetical protein A2V68_02795 [candidate division Kazan bacterium RBG_13_50_9]
MFGGGALMEQVPRSLWGMIAAAVIAAAALALILWKFDPYSATWPVFTLLFLSFWVIASGAAIPAVYFYQLRRGAPNIKELFTQAWQRGLIIGCTVTTILALLVMHVLSWWNGLSVVVIAVILDMYFRK